MKAEAGAFRHEALFYGGEDEFLHAVGTFIADGVADGEPALVVVSSPKIEKLRHRLGPGASTVEFADMARVGANPARIISAWEDFVRRQGGRGRPLRGVGEPIDASRRPAALAECQRHEALVNVAFADSTAWTLLCPYDTDALSPAVVAEARRNHPTYVEGGAAAASAVYQGLERIRGPFAEPLAPPTPPVVEATFADESALRGIRRDVLAYALAAGLTGRRADDLVVAVNEVATNSLRHGGGAGTLQLWRDGECVICEVRDRGVIDDALAGRNRPGANGSSGRGLWMVNQLCDLAQFRTVEGGTVARLHMAS